ncbi:MAG: hypothetical protein H8E21_03020 [Gammaproteobacteria bacterium]|nr:hypothetical protein [Gammaproteobacteria bacterium]
MPVFSFYGDSSARHQIKVMFNHVANFIDIFLSALGISDQASSQGMGCGGLFCFAQFQTNQPQWFIHITPIEISNITRNRFIHAIKFCDFMASPAQSLPGHNTAACAKAPLAALSNMK